MYGHYFTISCSLVHASLYHYQPINASFNAIFAKRRLSAILYRRLLLPHDYRLYREQILGATISLTLPR